MNGSFTIFHGSSLMKMLFAYPSSVLFQSIDLIIKAHAGQEASGGFAGGANPPRSGRRPPMPGDPHLAGLQNIKRLYQNHLQGAALSHTGTDKCRN